MHTRQPDSERVTSARSLSVPASAKRLVGINARGGSALMGAVSTAAGESVDVILRDGGTLRLRPPTSADSEALLEFYRALSSQSLHRRFHGLPNLRPQLVESLLEPDWVER